MKVPRKHAGNAGEEVLGGTERVEQQAIARVVTVASDVSVVRTRAAWPSKSSDHSLYGAHGLSELDEPAHGKREEEREGDEDGALHGGRGMAERRADGTREDGGERERGKRRVASLVNMDMMSWSSEEGTC